jgi:hypothetical protein
MVPTSPGEWQFCTGCAAKGPIPGCPLCRQVNGRDMTPEEDAALLEAIRKLPEGDYWLDVPFADGSTPRGRR